MIRSVKKQDVPALKTIIDSTELFPSEMLDDMIQEFLADPDQSPELWMTELESDIPISLVYCLPEKLTEGTYNALCLAVSPDHQGKGHGGKLMKHLEQELLQKDGRILLVETSGTDDFAKTRAFYEKIGYEQEARIRDYYSVGDDKIIYRKDLTAK